MNREDILAILSAHRAEIKDFGVKSLALFGSVARDEAGPESDVDLLVEFDRSIGLFHYAHLQQYLETLLGGAKVDLVMRRALLDELKDDILEEALDVV